MEDFIEKRRILSLFDIEHGLMHQKHPLYALGREVDPALTRQRMSLEAAVEEARAKLSEADQAKVHYAADVCALLGFHGRARKHLGVRFFCLNCCQHYERNPSKDDIIMYTR